MRVFERLPTGVRPTALGAVAAEQARRLLRAYEEAEDRIGGALAGRIRAGAAGLALMASGPYLAWLPLELLARLPGRPLSSLPLEFGRRRCPTGLVLRRSAESLASVRTLRDLIQDTAHRRRG